MKIIKSNVKPVRGFEVVIDEYRKTTGGVKLPTRGSKKAMAYDFYANGEYMVAPNAIVKVWTDVKAYMGDEECLIINVRSSMGGKFMLANTSGWIDADYYSNENNDGNIGICLEYCGEGESGIDAGDRIAQGIFIKYLITDDDVTRETRTGGFGSSGK
jgi:dUTP pyrophosphatase